MNIDKINSILSEIKSRLSADPVAEQTKPEQHNPTKLSGAQKRLAGLYKKLTTGRDDSTKVKATGAVR